MTSPSNDLPFEIVLLITSHLHYRVDLYHCALINKQFYAATIHRLWDDPMCGNDVSYLWHAPIYYGIPRHESSNIACDGGIVTCSTLIQCLFKTRQYQHTNTLRSFPLGHYIRKLDFNDEDLVTDSILLLSHTPFLEHLSLLGSPITDYDVECIWQFCPRLKSIYLFDMSFEELVGIGNYCHQLTSFIFESDSLFNPAAALAELQGCPLTCLSLARCEWYVEPTGARLSSEFDQLEIIYLVDCGHLTDEFFKILVPSATTFPSLTRLVLNNASLTPETANLMMKCLPLLADINIKLIQVVTNNILAALTSGPSLKIFDLQAAHYDVSSQGIRDIAIDSPQLTSLHIRGCSMPQRCFPEVDIGDDYISLNLDSLNKIRRNTGFRTTAYDDNRSDTSDSESSI
ncbi:hypothetical protein [Absidia glauca]|uniref:F-box domain-containing protein n=1 Tax=Absidia glauca TaxID=4829 RepID=A0A168Q3N7_ABSGL|nr:hypothetical protein [Absidia glauca]